MTLDVQFLSMFASAGMGILLGASFDTYRRFVKSPKRFRWTLVLNDILFWILQALLFFYVLLQINHGEVRFYLLLAIVLGYSIYRALFEKVYRKFLEVMINIVTNVTRAVVRAIKVLVINPIKWLLKLVLTLSMIVLTALWRILHFVIILVLSPFRWLWIKYIQAYGIPFYSLFKRIGHFFKKIKSKLRKLYEILKRSEKR